MGPGGAIALTQYFDMLSDPLKLADRRKSRVASEPANDGCGCCPICRDFVYVAFTQSGKLAACPHCGGLINGLDPLGVPSS